MLVCGKFDPAYRRCSLYVWVASTLTICFESPYIEKARQEMGRIKANQLDRFGVDRVTMDNLVWAFFLLVVTDLRLSPITILSPSLIIVSISIVN